MLHVYVCVCVCEYMFTCVGVHACVDTEQSDECLRTGVTGVKEDA